MFTFGWGEILLVLVVVIVVVGPKDLPKLIKQFSTFTKSIKKLSREFKSSLNEIANQEEFKEINKSIMEAKNIKDDLNIKDKFKSEVKSLSFISNSTHLETRGELYIPLSKNMMFPFSNFFTLCCLEKL